MWMWVSKTAPSRINAGKVQGIQDGNTGIYDYGESFTTEGHAVVESDDPYDRIETKEEAVHWIQERNE